MSFDPPKPHRVDVSIGGVTYHLSAMENEDYIREIAAKADEAFRALVVKNPSLSGMQTAVLLIINLMDNLTKMTSEHEALNAQTGAAASEYEACSKELFIQRDVNFEMKKELLRVNELNKQLMLELAALKSSDNIIEPEPEFYPDPDDEDEPLSEVNEPLPAEEKPLPDEEEEFSDFNQTTLEEYISNSL